MNIPFYQSEWFGINLASLADDLGHPRTAVANTHIYAAVYNRLLTEKKYAINPAWIEKKNTLSTWLLGYIKEKSLEKSKMLSVGCGLGVVEQPLIAQGFNLDLQECQSVSLDYLKTEYPQEYQKSNLIISEDLIDIPPASYDLVMAITSTYALDNSTLSHFLEAISRILKKGATFIFYETALTFSDIKYYLRKHITKRGMEGLLWGWKRSNCRLIQQIQKHGLVQDEAYYFDSNNHIVKPKNWFRLFFDSKIAWQMMIFKRA